MGVRSDSRVFFLIYFLNSSLLEGRDSRRCVLPFLSMALGGRGRPPLPAVKEDYSPQLCDWCLHGGQHAPADFSAAASQPRSKPKAAMLISAPLETV